MDYSGSDFFRTDRVRTGDSSLLSAHVITGTMDDLLSTYCYDQYSPVLL